MIVCSSCPGPAQAKRAHTLRIMSTSSLGLVSSVCHPATPCTPLKLYHPPFLPRIKLTCLFGIGCGLWNPEADPLSMLREDIDENAQRWKEVLRAPAMRREFLNGAADDDDAVVKAFAHHNRNSALKTKPKVWSISLLCLLATHPPENTAYPCQALHHPSYCARWLAGLDFCCGRNGSRR